MVLRGHWYTVILAGAAALAWSHSFAQSAAAQAPAATATTGLAASEDLYVPQGYERVAYVDCGAQESDGSAEGPRMKQVAGESRAFQGVEGPLGTVASSENRVEFVIEGLQATDGYLLDFIWWDADSRGRWQSVRFGMGESVDWTSVLPSVPPQACYADKPTWARVVLPIPPEFAATGRLRVAFVKDRGPDAVVSEIALWRRASADPGKRVLIVTGDDYGGHLWRETAPALAELLRKDPRLEVSIAEAPAILGSPLLPYYDAVVIHFKDYAERMPVSQGVYEGLAQFVAAGKGVALTHFGCGAFQEWQGFGAVAGRVWNPELRAHDPFGEFEVRMTAESHPITNGLEPFRVNDELYTCLDGDAAIQVLCEATSKVDSVNYPMAFVTTLEKGRAFHCVLGHNAEVYRNPGVEALCLRGVAWAAGLDPIP